MPNAGTLSSYGGCTSFLGLLGAAADYVRLNQLAAFVAVVELDNRNVPTGVPRYLFGDGCVGVLLRPSEESDLGFVAYDRCSGTDGSTESNRIERDMNEGLVFQSWGPYANALYMSGAAVKQVYPEKRSPRRWLVFSSSATLLRTASTFSSRIRPTLGPFSFCIVGAFPNLCWWKRSGAEETTREPASALRWPRPSPI